MLFTISSPILRSVLPVCWYPAFRCTVPMPTPAVAMVPPDSAPPRKSSPISAACCATARPKASPSVLPSAIYASMVCCHSLLSLAMRMSTNRLMKSLPTSSAPSVNAFFRIYLMAPSSHLPFSSASMLNFSVNTSAAPAMVPSVNACVSVSPLSFAATVASAAAPVPIMARDIPSLSAPPPPNPPVIAVFSRKSPILMPVWYRKLPACPQFPLCSMVSAT